MSAYPSPARSASVATIFLLLAIALIGRTEYGQTLFWSLTRLVAVALFLACCMAHRHAGMKVRDLGAATLWFSSLTVALALVGARAAIGESTFVAAGSVLFLVTMRLACARLGTAAAVMGSMGGLLIALVILTFTLPRASYLLAWPMLAALLAYGAGLLPVVAADPRMAIGMAGLIPAAALVMPFLTQLDALPAPMRGSFIGVGIVALLGCASGPLLGAGIRSAQRAELPCED